MRFLEKALEGMKLGKALEGASIRSNVSPCERLHPVQLQSKIYCKHAAIQKGKVPKSSRVTLGMVRMYSYLQMSSARVLGISEPNQVMVVRPQAEKDKFTAFVVARVPHLETGSRWDQSGKR